MPDELEEIIAEFITEAEESLDRIDPLFVEIETKGGDQNTLNEIFRSMHTIKGAAGFLGFQTIVDVAHAAENILKKLREGEISVTRELIDLILKGVDTLRLLLHHLKSKDGAEEDVSSLLEEFDGALDGKHGQDASPVRRDADTGPTEDVISPPLPGRPPVLSPSEEGQGGSDNQAMDPDQPFVSAPAEKDADAEKAAYAGREGSQTLRVDVGKIDKMMDLTGEVVLARNRLLSMMDYIDNKYSGDPHLESLVETVSFLDIVTSDMQAAVMQIRMQPIKKVFNKFPRLVRDLSNSLGKEVDLKISGEATEVDKTVIEHIGDPLVHIIRNAIDHGIEPLEERAGKGKPRNGTIGIMAYQRGGQIVIEVSDDGGGIEVDRVKKTAAAKGLITEDECARMPDNEAINLIFLPGFSTTDVATELSGRGVGMDVVRTKISKLNGYTEVITKKDAGTTFRIIIPLTLAIIQVLMVRSSASHYAIPITAIEETLKISKKDVTDVAGQKVINIRERVLPIFELSDILGNGRGNGGQNGSDQRYVVVIAIGDTRFCIALDELLGQEEIVIKAIEGMYADSAYVLGATIRGDGKVVLILDPAGISRNRLGSTKT